MERNCGDCQLCCKLIPVEEIGKKASERCKNQRSGLGCVIYPNRPLSCRAWNCQWLVNPKTAHLLRPDRSHYVIDITPDVVRARNNDSGEELEFPAVQVWVDPAYPKAHEDHRLRNWLNGSHQIALVRYNSREGLVLIPPSLTGKDWRIEVMELNMDMIKSQIAMRAGLLE